MAEVLAEMKLDSTAIAAGLLHDAVEDTPVTTEDITAEFGEQVAHIVEGVTKIDKIQFANREDRQAENVRKMLLAMVSATCAWCSSSWPTGCTTCAPCSIFRRSGRRPSRARRSTFMLRWRTGWEWAKCAASLKTWPSAIPIRLALSRCSRRGGASRRGRAVPARRGDAAQREARGEQHQGARGVAHQAALQHQPEDLKQKISVDQVYDLLALRVITASVPDCYAVFGLIHSIWRPVPGRIKDFIAMPRPNLYQSLHTTVMGEGGHQFEVQIRTEEMHRIAEEGIAAHWKYKAGDARQPARRAAAGLDSPACRVAARDDRPQRVPLDLKIDLYPEEVYTFTPKGKVVVPGQDGTPLDFAYSIHTEVGNTCVGAKVNGRIVPLRSRLRNGDIVEMVTQNGHTPSRDWLTFVKSSRARNKIKHWLNEHQRSAPSKLAASCSNAKRASTKFRWPRLKRRTSGASPPTTAWPPQRPAGGHRLREVLRAAGAEPAAPGLFAARAERAPNQTAGGEAPMSDAVRKLHLHRHRFAPGGRPERSAGLSRAMLQSDPRRRDHRLRNSRQRRRRPRAQLSQRAESAL